MTPQPPKDLECVVLALKNATTRDHWHHIDTLARAAKSPLDVREEADAINLLHLTHYKQLLSADDRAKLEKQVNAFLKECGRGIHNVEIGGGEHRNRNSQP